MRATAQHYSPDVTTLSPFFDKLKGKTMNMDMMFSPEKYGMKQCDHCNGYGSSLKEGNGRCSKCGGSGLIKKEEKDAV